MPRRTVLAAALLLLSVVPCRALFHSAVIDELMSGAGGDASIQYVEIRMLGASQNMIGNTRLAAFSCDGTSVDILLLVPGPNLPNAIGGARWIMASPGGAAFLAAAGISPDRVWDRGVTGSIPTACGQVCWGAPGLIPPAPTWDATDPDNYVDCVAYGPYTGPRASFAGPVLGVTPGDGTLSLTRTGTGVMNDNVFALTCPSPRNNAGANGAFGPCTPPATTTTTAATSTTGVTATTTTFPPGVGQLLSGTRLVLKARPDPSVRKLSASSHDPGLTLGEGRGSADDPTANGGTLRLVAQVGEPFDVSFALPAPSWRAAGRRGYRYRQRTRERLGPVREIVLKAGRLLLVRAAGGELPFTLAGNPNPVAVVLTMGAERYCMQFGGEVRFRPGRRLKATAAPPPASCPP